MILVRWPMQLIYWDVNNHFPACLTVVKFFVGDVTNQLKNFLLNAWNDEKEKRFYMCTTSVVDKVSGTQSLQLSVNAILMLHFRSFSILRTKCLKNILKDKWSWDRVLNLTLLLYLEILYTFSCKSRTYCRAKAD